MSFKKEVGGKKLIKGLVNCLVLMRKLHIFTLAQNDIFYPFCRID